MEDTSKEHIRTYTFPVSGYIPGIPGYWHAGQSVTVDENTMQVLDVFPKPVEPVVAQEKDTTNTEGQGEALPQDASITHLTDALKQMGG